MKCPTYDHVSETKVKCEAFGEANERAAREQLDHVEYLLTWLDERASVLGPERHARLNDEALAQMESLKDTLGLKPPPRKHKVRRQRRQCLTDAPGLAAPPREPQEIARELASLQATFDQVSRWGQRDALPTDAAAALSRCLAAQLDALRAELAGRPAEVRTPSQLQVIAFALESLPVWRRDVPLRAADVTVLERHLRAERDALVKELRDELALTQAAHAHAQRWADAPALCPRPTGDLCAYLAASSNNLKTDLADDAAEIQAPSDLRVLDFVLASLPLWAEEIPLPGAEVNALREHVSERRRALLLALARQRALVLATLEEAEGWSRAAGIAGFPINRALRQQADELAAELQGRSVSVQPPSQLQVIDYALASLPSWGRETSPGRVEARAMRSYLERRRRALLQPVTPLSAPAPAAVPTAPPPPPAAQPAPAPPSAPPPRGPAFTFDWADWWDNAWGLVASGALLKGLLYLGAFMIVIASAVLVMRYWEQFPSTVKLVFIAAVPLVFYATGFVLRKWFTTPVAGGVFSGIGALLVAVDFMIVYQLPGGLAGAVDARLYWLAASVFCTTIYALTAWRLPSEFFGYITLAGVCSTTLAFASLLSPDLEWHIAALSAAGVAMLWGSARLHRAPERWKELAKAAWRLPQILIPVCQALVLLVPGDAWLGQLATFLLAALAYAWLAFDPRCDPKLSAVLAKASVWSTIPAAGFALRAVALPPQWYVAAAAVLAPAYGLTGRALTMRSKTGRFAAQGLPAREVCLGLLWAGYGLTVLAILGGFGAIALGNLRFAPDYVLAGIVALTLAALTLALFANLFRRPLLVLAAGGLFIVPFSVAITYHGLDRQTVPQWFAWLMGAWTGLALTYLVVAALLRRAERYAAWLNFWALVLTPLALLGLSSNWAVTSHDSGFYSAPTLVALGGAILVYVVSAVIHDSGRHPALSVYAKLLPSEMQAAIFLWPLGFLLPFWLALAWWSSGNDWVWFGALLTGLGLVYVGLGQVLALRKVEYRLPPHAYAYVLGAVGVVVALGEPWALLVSLLLGVGILAYLAVVYRRVGETALAALLFVWPFHLGLQLSPLPQDVYALAYSLLASLGYIPLGRWLEKAGRQFALPAYVIGYALSALALVAALVARFGPGAGAITWVGVAVPLVITASQVWSVHLFKRPEFAWTAVLVLAIAYGQTLAFLGLPPAYHAAAWVSLALTYMVTERSLAWQASAVARPDGQQAWYREFRWPLGAAAAALCALGLCLTIPHTGLAFIGQALPPGSYPPLLLAQGLAVGLTILAARAYRSRWPLYLEPWLAFFPVTLFFIAYGGRLNDAGSFVTPFSASAYALIWAALALVHLCVAAAVDRAPVRYAHGLYLGGYGLGLLAIFWALQDQAALFWTLGLGIAAAVGSAWLVHLGRHPAWDELMAALFGPQPSTERRVARGAFLWFAAWTFPFWCVLLLRQLGVTDRYQWLGLAGSALLLLGLAQWLRRLERSYAWPLFGAAHFYTAVGLIISAPLTARLLGGYPPSDTPDASALILQSALGVVFYAGSAWLFRSRLLAHVAAWLSIVPYTLAWLVHGPVLQPAQFAWVWMGWAALLPGLGLLLDRRRARYAHERYAHGPYLAGYLLGFFALLWSAQDPLTCLYTLAAAIGLAATSHLLIHVGQHRSFEDFVRFFWRAPGTLAERMIREIFLFFAVYGFPVWLVLLLSYRDVPLPWRGVVLALVAPLYIVCGLAVRRVKSTYAWPFYSAGYALTAIGAMLTFGDQELVIVTLTLNTVVFAVSAYIFMQPFWLYLSTALVPVIVLLTLDYNQALTAPWVAALFMALSFLYFAAGQWFDRRPGSASETLSPFALPFYAPAYLLSAIALVVASAEQSLALVIYSAAVGLYAISARALREPLFFYPAVWLTIVPYYLLLTRTPLPSRWFGLGWLPLIVACIAAGRSVFPARHPHIRNLRALMSALTRPATPFFLLAYGLTLLMVAASWHDQLVLACALAAAAAVYLASAALFQHPLWLYPGLAAAHLSLATGASLIFSGPSAHAIPLPFLGLTWAMALVGLFFSRHATERGRGLTKDKTTGDWAFVGRLFTPGWASPFFQFAAFDLIFWQLVALPGVESTVLLGLGYAALLVLFATLWVDGALVYAALGCFLLTLASALRWAQLPFAVRMAWMAVSGFGLYLLAWIIERLAPRVKLRAGALDVWPGPLTQVAIGLTSLAVVATIPTIAAYTIATAAALAAAGALALTIAYRRRHLPLGYAGAAMLLLAWTLVLIAGKVSQPQSYAIPAGLYLVAIGVLERQHGPRSFALYIESLGLTVLLLTSFVQSVDAVMGLPYFLLLLVQALLVILWGAVRRVKIPFFMGIGTSVFNVVAQLIVLLAAARRASAHGDPLLVAVLIVLSVGLVLCLLAVVVERQRARLLARAQEWRLVLDTWD